MTHMYTAQEEIRTSIETFLLHKLPRLIWRMLLRFILRQSASHEDSR